VRGLQLLWLAPAWLGRAVGTAVGQQGWAMAHPQRQQAEPQLPLLPVGRQPKEGLPLGPELVLPARELVGPTGELPWGEVGAWQAQGQGVAGVPPQLPAAAGGEVMAPEPLALPLPSVPPLQQLEGAGRGLEERQRALPVAIHSPAPVRALRRLLWQEPPQVLRLGVQRCAAETVPQTPLLPQGGVPQLLLVLPAWPAGQLVAVWRQALGGAVLRGQPLPLLPQARVLGQLPWGLELLPEPQPVRLLALLPAPGCWQCQRARGRFGAGWT